MNTITLELKVGSDNGNSEHDIVINNKLIKQANVFAKITKLPMLDEVSKNFVINNIEDNLITSISSKSLNGGAYSTYYVGNYAIKSGKMLKNIEVGAFNSKVDSDIPVVNTLSQIAGYGAKEAYKIDNNVNKIICNVDMTTALPVTQYNRNNALMFANKFIENKHTVNVHLGNDSIEVEIIFNYVKVLPESIPVIFHLQSLEKNNSCFEEFNQLYELNIDGSYFKNKKVLHIAIGEGTTEYPITEDIRFNPNFITGSNNGIGHAINSVLNNFIQERKLIKFSRQDFSAVLKDINHKYFDDATEIIETSLEEQAEIVLRYAKSEVGKANNDVDIICVHGGGSILLKEFLNDELLSFCKSTDIKLFYAPKNEAVTLEVQGLYAFTNSTIFESLKNKYNETESSVNVG